MMGAITKSFNPAELRRSRRYDVSIFAKLLDRGREITVQVVNISAGGACLRLPPNIIGFLQKRGMVVHVDGYGRFACEMRWRLADRVGVQFAISRDRREALAKTLAENLDGDPR